MFAQFPILIAPIDHIATVVQTLRGHITTVEGSDEITTTADLVVEAPIGSKLIATIEGEEVVLGYVGQIFSSTRGRLETPAPVTVTAHAPVTVHIYRAGFVAGANNYLYPRKAKPLLIADIFRRVTVSENFVKNASVLLPYTVLEQETPEMVSYKFYGNPFFHWVLLLINNIVDVRNEWPLSEDQLLSKILDQYAVPLTGVITVTAGSTVVTGTGTQFLTDFSPLNQAVLTPKTVVLGHVEAVSSNTTLRLTHPAPRSYSGRFQRCHKDAIYRYVHRETGYTHDFDAGLVAQGVIVPQTIHEYEIALNEAKRAIKVLRADFMNDFVRDFNLTLNSAI